MGYTLEKHNKILTTLWYNNLNKERGRAYALLGVTPDFKSFSIHAMPGSSNTELAKLFREAADSLDKGKLIVLH